MLFRSLVGYAANRGAMSHRFIYIVRCNDYYKIGIADNPRDRFYSLQNGNPYLLELLAIYEISSQHIKYAENRLHRALKRWIVRGEWFSLTDGQLDIVKGQCGAYTKIFR